MQVVVISIVWYNTYRSEIISLKANEYMKKKTKNKIKKFIKKMTIKVSERLLLVVVIYAIFRLFNIRLSVGF